MQHDSTGSFLPALLAGLATGARSLAPAAYLVSRDRHPVVGALLGAAAAGEVAADKVLPLPERTEPLPLAGRVLLGGATGALLARSRGGSPVLATAAGAGAALAGAWLFTTTRRGLTRRGVPDALVGAAEDMLVVKLTRAAAHVPPAADALPTEVAAPRDEAEEPVQGGTPAAAVAGSGPTLHP